MSSSEGSLDDVFEEFVPIDNYDVEAFIDSQFNLALGGEELELHNSDYGEPQESRSKMDSQIEQGYGSMSFSFQSFDSLFATDTHMNLDRANSLPSGEELQRSGPLCSRCRESLDKDGMASFGAMEQASKHTKKDCDGGIELKEETTDPREAEVTELQLCEISDDVGTCWRELGPKLKIEGSKIHNLDDDYKKNRDKANCLLLMWKQQEGKSATVGRLADHLKSIRRTSIAEKLLGVTEVQFSTCSAVNTGDVINLTVKCNLNTELDSKVMLCEDAKGNKYMLREVSSIEGHWNCDEIQKNKQFLETVAVAAKDMGKTPEERRQESLKRISSEVQELRQKLKRVKLDFNDTKSCVDETDDTRDSQPEKELLEQDPKVPQLGADHLLQSCEEQQALCQRLYNALIKLIGEVGQPRDDNFACIAQLCDFTKELKEQENILCPRIKSLLKSKDHLDEQQAPKVDELDKSCRAQKAQIEGVEKLLSSLLVQGNIAKSQKMLKRRSEPVLAGKPSSGFSRGRSKTDSSKSSSKSQSLSELQNVSVKSSISGPFCPQRMCLMETDKKVKK